MSPDFEAALAASLLKGVDLYEIGPCRPRHERKKTGTVPGEPGIRSGFVRGLTGKIIVLSSQAESFYYRSISFYVLVFHVVQKSAAPADQHQQSSS